MAMEPIPSVTPVVTAESSGNIEQTGTKINCIFTYGTNPENSGAAPADADNSLAEFRYLQGKINRGETLLDIEQERYDELYICYGDSDDLVMSLDERQQQNAGLENQLFSVNNEIITLVLREHPELDPTNRADNIKINEYCRDEKAKILIKMLELNCEVADLSYDELTGLSYAYDAIINGAQMGMAERGIQSLAEYYSSLSPSEIAYYETLARNEFKTHVPKSALISSGRRNAIEAIDANTAKQQYYDNMLAFLKSGSVEGVNVTNINDVAALKQSDDFAKIEYQYLKSKGDLSDAEKKKLAGYEKALEVLHDLTGYKLPSDGDGSYLAEFKTEKYRTENMAKNGENADEKMKEDLKNKLRADLENLPPDERRSRIVEIMGTAKDDEGALLAQALLELQKENQDLLPPDVLYGALKDSGASDAAIAAVVFQNGGKELQEIVAADLAKQIKEGTLTLTASQFEALWQYFSDDVKKIFNDSCGDKVTELLQQAERERATEKSESATDQTDNTTGSGSSYGNGTLQMPNYSTQSNNIFGNQPLYYDVDYQVVPPSPMGVVPKMMPNMTSGSQNTTSDSDNTTQNTEQIVQEIKTTNDPIRRAELFTLLPERTAIALVISDPEKYIDDIKVKDDRLYHIIIEEWKMAMAGNTELQIAYEKEFEQNDNIA